MKITSVIFLIVGIVISIGGYALCSMATKMANDAGAYDMLFEYNYDDEGNIIEEYSFSKDTVIELDKDGKEITKKAVRKVSLTFSNIKIHIVGGQDRSRVVFRNLAQGRYYYFISNEALYVTDELTITNVIQSEGLGFDGLRKYLNTGKYKGEPEVVLFISDVDDLHQYDFNFNNCEVTLENLSGSYDMRLTAKNSKINMQNCRTESTLRLTLDKCQTTIAAVDFNETLIKGSGGTLSYDDTSIAYLFRYDISSEGGSLNLNGVDQEFPSYTANLSGEDYHSLSIAMVGTELTVRCNG